VRVSRSLAGTFGRLSTARRAAALASVAATLALVVLTAQVFAPQERLQIAGLWLLCVALLAGWVAVLAWRVPVYGRRRLGAFAGIWFAGIGISAYLAVLSTNPVRDLLWQRSVQGLALALSLVVGALFLRALLRVRASSLVGRLLSLVSPIAVLTLIILLSLAET